MTNFSAGSKAPREQQNNDNNKEHAEDTDAPMSEAVTVSAEASAEATQQKNDEKNDEDAAQRHF